MQKKTQNRIFDINSKAAKTFEQNSKEVTAAAQDSASRFNASVNSGNGSGSSSIYWNNINNTLHLVA